MLERLTVAKKFIFAIPQGLTPLLLITVPVLSLALAGASAQANSTSPLMTNLAGVSYYSSEQPFLNIFEVAGNFNSIGTGLQRGWITQNTSAWDTNEENYISLDANGWPTSVSGPSGTKFTGLGVLLNRTNSPYYPGGQYVVLYDGAGTLAYGFDASLVSSSPGRDIINVTPSGNGISLQIKTTDPSHTGNYLRNIRVVQAAYESALKSGQIFHPTFLAREAPFRGFRFMDWMSTNNSVQSAWANRPKQTDAFWGNSGVPAEIMVNLLNTTGADGWFNMPHLATDDYITQFATLVHSTLNSTSKVYVEFSNEVWNFAFQQAAWAVDQGVATWPNNTNKYYAGDNYYGMRFAQMCNIWKTVWGADSHRVVCVLATQAAAISPTGPLPAPGPGPQDNSGGVGYQNLNCPLAISTLGKRCYQFADSIAIAPYFGYDVPDSWTTQADGGLASLFTEITQGGLAPSGYPGGMIKLALDWVTTWKAGLTAYNNLDLIAYEGGQSFVNANDSALTNLYIAANRDSRMGAAYAQYLQGWKTAGGNLFSHYSDTTPYSQFGNWGALENIMNTTSPKYSALTNFMNASPCWWTGCNQTPPSTTGSSSSSDSSSSSSSSSSSAAAPNPLKVMIVLPANGYTVQGKGPVLIGVGTFDSLAITSIVIKGDGTVLASCTNAISCAALWPLNGLTSGTHIITAIATDVGSNQTSTSISVVLQ